MTQNGLCSPQGFMSLDRITDPSPLRSATSNFFAERILWLSAIRRGFYSRSLPVSPYSRGFYAQNPGIKKLSQATQRLHVLFRRINAGFGSRMVQE